MSNENASVGSAAQTVKPRPEQNTGLRDILRGNRQSGQGGLYAVCSAHQAVIEAAVQQSLEDGSMLLVRVDF